MAQHPNAEIADKILRAMERMDREAISELLDENVKHWVPQSATNKFPAMPQPIEGRQAVTDLFKHAPERYKSLRYDDWLTFADDNGAAVLTVMHGVPHDGRDFVNRYAWFFKIENGKIVEMVEQPDTAYAFDFFGI
jgi:ketosteroid isomerase-like protein